MGSAVSKQKEEKTLIQKLAEIRKSVDVIKKDKRGFNYNYSDITTILAKITTGMKTQRVSLIPKIMPGTTSVVSVPIVSTKVDKQGKVYKEEKTEMLVTADMVFIWVNDDNPDDTIEVPWFLTGSQSDPSQSFGSAITYCTRYFYTSYFQIAQTDNDVDTYRTKQLEAERAEQKVILEEIKKTIDSSVRGYIANNPNESDKVKAFMELYVKGGNYRTISDAILASKLLTDFNEKFLNEE